MFLNCRKTKIIGFLGAVLLSTLFAFVGQSAFAESVISKGLIEDSNGVRWEYILDNDESRTDETQKLSIAFYDKPESNTTVKVPALSELIGKVPGALESLNTYYLVDADIQTQETDYGTDHARRTASASTTVLDMTDTSKIQIMGVYPIIDPTVETELVFGENMVIGDGTSKGVMQHAQKCGTTSLNDWYGYINCWDTVELYAPIPNFRSLTEEEINNYAVSGETFSCFDLSQTSSANYDKNRTYCRNFSLLKNQTLGAFSGYKLKLTNFSSSNFNYVGWNAFAYSEISGKSVTIDGNSFMGGDIFKSSNLESVTILTDSMGSGLFRDCAALSSVSFGDAVTTVASSTFAGTGLTSFDFSTTNIKRIEAYAFENAKLSSINLEGVNSINYRAFAGNDITELYLPKSINDLGAELFDGNKNMKKLTVAYDTLTSGTTLPLFVVLDNDYSDEDKHNPSKNIEEVVVLAPYGEGEQVSDTHVTYDQYKWHFNANDRHYMPECPDHVTDNICNGNAAASNDYGMAQYGAYEMNYYDMDYYGTHYTLSDRENYRGSGSDFEKQYADVDSKKNVIAPEYFADMTAIKKVTIGDGYEFIGSSAFTDWGRFDEGCTGSCVYLSEGNDDSGLELNLPDSLKGIGNFAFDRKFRDKINIEIPKNIEFIGIYAFYNTYFYDKDVDFPNLIALGDHAFERTRTRNIYLHDKLQYMGAQVFSDCVFLNDITFDLDVFNPDIYIAWALPHRHGPSWYDSQFHFTTEFGPRSSWYVKDSDIAKYGLSVNKDQVNNFWPLKFGTITFTDKNKSQLPNGYHNCYYYADDSGRVSDKCPGGTYGTGIYNTFFGHVNAKKIDLGGTDWKVLSARMFVQSSTEEVVLPHSLEVIPGDTFSDAYMKEELILPDTLKVIGDAAFDYGQVWSSDWDTNHARNVDFLESHTIKITKLPASLEFIGNDAFWGDYNLTADLNSPNLKQVGYKAFWGTNLRDVYLPNSIKELNAAAFSNIPTLRNITIDFDLGALAPNYTTFNPADFPQSFQDYAGANLYQLYHMSCSAKNMADPQYYKVTTFYSLFNQNIVYDVKDSSGVITSYGQKNSNTHFGKVKFTENAKTDIWMTGTGYFAGLEFDELDLGDTDWKYLVKVPFGLESTKIGKLTLPHGLENVPVGAMESAEISEPFELPSTLKVIDVSAFQWTKGTYTNELPEGLTDIHYAAFYASDMTDNLVIPSTVTVIQPSAFNAGDADVHYDTITVKPENIDFNMASGQLMHQMFWQNDVDKMIIDSKTLPAAVVGKTEGYQEFWHMPFDELVLNNLEKVTYKACEGCTNLQKVDASQNANLRLIDDYAFAGDEKLNQISFSPEVKNEVITVGSYPFQGTAFETMGDSSKQFDLTAAKFDATAGHSFSEMPKLRTVDIPENFSKNAIPVATFHNDAELEEATVDWHIEQIDDAAFSNDNKLARIFIWGNTVVEDSRLEGYTAPERVSAFGRGGGDEDDDATAEGEGYGYTIPEGADIYAYSSNVTEAYAGNDTRKEFEGVFYPLDEVIYLTSNKPRVKIDNENNDFDKSDVVVYGLRRDGVVLESDNWGEFDGVAYPRSESDLSFERMAGVIEEKPEFGTVWDTPVPVNMLSLANENFRNIGFELVRDDENPDSDVRLINVIYTDAYTQGEPDTDIDPYADSIPDVIEEIIETIVTPFTGDRVIYSVILLVVSVLGFALIMKKRKKYNR